MNTQCRTHIHPDEVLYMERQENETIDGKVYAVWKCPRCGNSKRQAVRRKRINVEEPVNG
jgi:hypothetical protein